MIATRSVIVVRVDPIVITETMSNIQMMMIKRKKSISGTIDITTMEVNVTIISAPQTIAVDRPTHSHMAAIENIETNKTTTIVQRMSDAMIIFLITIRSPKIHGSTNDLGTSR